jgi:hypothetical protein
MTKENLPTPITGSGHRSGARDRPRLVSRRARTGVIPADHRRLVVSRSQRGKDDADARHRLRKITRLSPSAPADRGQ